MARHLSPPANSGKLRQHAAPCGSTAGGKNLPLFQKAPIHKKKLRAVRSRVMVKVKVRVWVKVKVRVTLPLETSVADGV